MALSQTQTFGFSETVQEIVDKERAALAKAGLNPAAILGTLQSLHNAAVAANEAQEAAKRNARQTTSTFDTLKDELYEMSSGVLDMAIAAVGKNSDAGKNLRRYRSRIRRPQRGEIPPPVPTPSPQ
jgi:hypothetical protein